MIVEAAETLFVPAAVYNNTKGDADAEVVAAFEEPSWNNPVVRFVRADRADLVPRIERRWTADALLDGMVAALRAHEAEVPAWLELIAQERRAHQRGVETAIFGMG